MAMDALRLHHIAYHHYAHEATQLCILQRILYVLVEIIYLLLTR